MPIKAVFIKIDVVRKTFIEIALGTIDFTYFIGKFDY